MQSTLINKVEAFWTFGGVLNSLAGNHRGTTLVHTVNSTHIILQHTLVLKKIIQLETSFSWKPRSRFSF